MTFTVTYRAKDGALREERVEAASRAECVAECRRLGIAPTGIKEGKPRKPGDSGKSGKSGRRQSEKPATRPACCCTLVVSPSAAVTLMGFMPISMRRRGFGRKAEAPCILDDTKLIQNEYKN